MFFCVCGARGGDDLKHGQGARRGSIRSDLELKQTSVCVVFEC